MMTSTEQCQPFTCRGKIGCKRVRVKTMCVRADDVLHDEVSGLAVLRNFQHRVPQHKQSWHLIASKRSFLQVSVSQSCDSASVSLFCVARACSCVPNAASRVPWGPDIQTFPQSETGSICSVELLAAIGHPNSSHPAEQQQGCCFNPGWSNHSLSCCNKAQKLAVHVYT